MIAPVRKADFPFLADWFAISLRWLILLAITASLVFASAPDARFLIVIGAEAIWNSFMAVLALNNQRLQGHRLVNAGFDLLACLALFILSGGLSGPIAWCSLLVLFSAAIYYEWRGSLLAALLISLIEAAAAVVLANDPTFHDFWFPIGLLIGLNLAAGAALGFLALPLMGLVRRRYRAALAAQQESERRTQYQEQLIELQETARRQLARELHDGPTQSITALAVRANLARRMLAENPTAAVEELERIEELAGKATREIRHMLFNLRPLALESQGLQAALETMSDKMEETYRQNVILEIDSTVIEQLDASKQTVIFYLAEEAVSNARKHADAAQIWLRLNLSPRNSRQALLEVEDNGKGFDLYRVNASYEKRGSLGLINLQERAALINAKLTIESAPGRGTRVQVIIPLTQQEFRRTKRGTDSQAQSK